MGKHPVLSRSGGDYPRIQQDLNWYSLNPTVQSPSPRLQPRINLETVVDLPPKKWNPEKRRRPQPPTGVDPKTDPGPPNLPQLRSTNGLNPIQSTCPESGTRLFPDPPSGATQQVFGLWDHDSRVEPKKLEKYAGFVGFISFGRSELGLPMISSYSVCGKSGCT